MNSEFYSRNKPKIYPGDLVTWYNPLEDRLITALVLTSPDLHITATMDETAWCFEAQAEGQTFLKEITEDVQLFRRAVTYVKVGI